MGPVYLSGPSGKVACDKPEEEKTIEKRGPVRRGRLPNERRSRGSRRKIHRHGGVKRGTKPKGGKRGVAAEKRKVQSRGDMPLLPKKNY